MATTEGVVRPPSWLGITTGSPPCMTATTELVVPRSIPIILLIQNSLYMYPMRLDRANIHVERPIVKLVECKTKALTFIGLRRPKSPIVLRLELADLP